MTDDLRKPLPRLPVDAHLASLRMALRTHRAAVLVAAPGAGKTTRVPPALADAGPVLVLQPRRAAARALARRVADEQGWTLGREVGWHVRFEPHFAPDTRVLFATEGILTARLQHDPLLEGFATVVLDEFHERSVHADLGLALAAQAWRARDDLRLLVMSATIDPAPVAAFLDHCAVVSVPGEPHPLDVEYAPDEGLPSVIERVLHRRDGNVLAFLPGTREIEGALQSLTSVAGRFDVDVLPLHGSLPADAQDRALASSTRRRIVLATNIAETSVTVPGVRTVVDCGWQKVARYDTARGLDTLQTERVSLDAADQRAGRAARLGPGLAIRLWSARDTLRPTREPELARIDLSSMILSLHAWGADDPTSFAWFEAPQPWRIAEATRLLARLGATHDGRISSAGRAMARLPLPPRLARLVIDTHAHPDACLIAAMLSDGRPPTADGRTAESDLWSLLASARGTAHIRRAADAIARAASERSMTGDTFRLDEESLGRAVLAAFPDRVAQRRIRHGDALLLASGTGARLSPASGVRHAEFLVALEVRGIDQRDPIVHLASGVDRSWLQPTHHERHAWVDQDGRLRAVRRRLYDALRLGEQPDTLLEEDRAVLAEAWLAAPMREADRAWLARVAFAGGDVSLERLLSAAVAGASRLSEIDLAAGLPWDMRQRLLTDAPERLALPSGRTAALIYDDDGGVRAAVKLQELFGLAETPRIGPRRVPVTFELLSPAGRPVQTTRDLRSFWTTTYPEVRRELRARYPKHPWPEDPWTATPTHRTVGRTP